MGASQGADIGHISIHALLAESDCENSPQIKTSSISIHALLAESDSRRVLGFVDPDISIHALLAESDLGNVVAGLRTSKFLSTLSLRRATGKVKVVEPGLAFLSTLSLRRATAIGRWGTAWRDISIHALLAESDRARVRARAAEGHFYPRSPCGERHGILVFCGPQGSGISIHALLAESDDEMILEEQIEQISIHALLAESDDNLTQGVFNLFTFLSTLSLRRATEEVIP